MRLNIRSAVFDLDNTLLSTEMLKQKLWTTVASQYGLSEHEGKDLYIRVRDQEFGNSGFTLEQYRKQLETSARKSLSDIDIDALWRSFEKYVQTIVVSGSFELLNYLSSLNISLYLLSLGSGPFQRQKLQWSQLHSFFSPDKIVIVQEKDIQNGKIFALKRIFGNDFSGENILIFDDKPDEIHAFLEAYPQLQAAARREKDDTRYLINDFQALEQKFSGRMIWGNDMHELLQKIKIYM